MNELQVKICEGIMKNMDYYSYSPATFITFVKFLQCRFQKYQAQATKIIIQEKS